jgi:hypothetical protein
MRILNLASYSIQSGEVTIVTSDKFSKLALPSQLDMLKLLIDDLQTIHDNIQKEWNAMHPIVHRNYRLNTAANKKEQA